MKTFYLTTPIYYPNARPHVGSAYTTIVCDVLARYKRMCGYDVAFLTGTDEHGEKLQRAADSAGIPVERFVAEKRELFRHLWARLAISEYRFVHTSQDPAHRDAIQWMIRQADKAGYIETKKYEGRYCVSDERYVSDGPEPATCDICGRPAELISEENHFFKLSAFEDRLLDLYEKHPEFVLPDHRRNEVTSFVRSGLRDISVSRKRLKWGIPWPGDDQQVVYVWYDALTSYLTGIGFEGEKRSKDFEKYWPADLHMIGKDILRFHAVYWPAFLMAAGLPLPKTIFAHGWIYYEREKMSKSKGNVVYPEPIVESKGFVPKRSTQASDAEYGKLVAAVQLVGNDALRYYLLRDTPFGLDGSFSYEGLIQRYNSDLANDLGNLASRTITMLQRYMKGIVPQPGEHTEPESKYSFLAVGPQTATAVCRHFNTYDFSNGLAEAWHLVETTNYYLAEKEPWTLAQDTSKLAQLAQVLYNAAEALRFLAVLLYPVLPASSERLWRLLGQQGDIGREKPDMLTWGALKPGTKVGKPEPIFPRLDKAATLAKLYELAEIDRERDQSKETLKPVEPETVPPGLNPAQSKTPEESPAPSSEFQTPAGPSQPAAEPKISIDDFAKVEMRVGEVLAAEPIPGAKKLLRLQVDIGTEVRQVCAGIAEYYKPEDLIGMKVVVVTNLAPRKLRGVESNGMIVAASVGDGDKPVLVTFKEDVPKGARLK